MRKTVPTLHPKLGLSLGWTLPLMWKKNSPAGYQIWCLVSFSLLSPSLRIFPCPPSKRHSVNESPLYCIHLPIIVSYNCSREQFSWRRPRASSTPRALCFILRSDRFSVTPIPRRPPLIVLHLWWWFSQCYPKQPHVCESSEKWTVCARVLADASVFIRSRGMRALTSC